MIRGLYTAVSGMVASMRRMEVLTNNLTNADTIGFKQERTAAASFAGELVAQLDAAGSRPVGPLTLAQIPQAPALDLTQGPLRASGRDLDVALDGPGFLALETPDGPRYTRAGTLTRDAEGYLTTNTGARVLGADGGPLQLPPGAVVFDADGTVRVDDAAVGQLQLVEFGPDQALSRLGQNELVPRDGAAPQPAAATRVRQGFVEGSNVDLTGTLTMTLELQRAYEANHRMIQYQDQLMQRAANDIARPN
jgi:flagellar basal-body rod protein FlgG